MARPGSKNPDYNEALFPDDRSPMMHERYHARNARAQERGYADYAAERGFHDRRKEGRRHTPSDYHPTAMEREQEYSERRADLESASHGTDDTLGQWPDKMIAAQDYEEGDLEHRRG